jgi:hypothetical protein
LLAYVRYVHEATGATRPVKRKKSVESRVWLPASPYFWLAVLVFALGLMSKPMLVTLPFVMLLLDYWPLRRVTGDGRQVTEHEKPIGKFSIPTLLLEKWPFFALATASCLVTFIAQQRGHAGILQEPYPNAASFGKCGACLRGLSCQNRLSDQFGGNLSVAQGNSHATGDGVGHDVDCDFLAG